MKAKLIITADDYGMSPSINHAIEECLRVGTVRATCAMVNMPEWGDTESLRQDFSGATIGIHWNLTQGRPLLPPSQVPSLVKVDGNFQGSSALRRGWLMGRVKLSEIQAELQLQYQRFCELAGAPDFWNTHQNFHVFPGLFKACVRLARDLGIPAMRCHGRLTVPRDISESSFHFYHPLFSLKGYVIALWSQKANALGMLMPDSRLYMPGYGPGLAAIEEVLSRVPWHNVRTALEMVAHPATAVDSELFGGLRESRVLEYKTLRDPNLVERLRRTGIEIVGFESLGQGA